MRFVIFSLFLAACLIPAGCQSNTSAGSVAAQSSTSPEKPQTDAAPPPAGTAHLWVKGMACPMCVTNIDKQLKKIPGVTNVAVNLGTGEVRATYGTNKPPTREQFTHAVEQSGLTLERVDMPIQ